MARGGSRSPDGGMKGRPRCRWLARAGASGIKDENKMKITAAVFHTSVSIQGEAK